MAYTYNVHTPKRSIATFDRASVAFFSIWKNKNSNRFLKSNHAEMCREATGRCMGAFDEYNKQTTNFMDGTKISLLTRKLSICSKHFLGISTGTYWCHIWWYYYHSVFIKKVPFLLWRVLTGWWWKSPLCGN